MVEIHGRDEHRGGSADETGLWLPGTSPERASHANRFDAVDRWVGWATL
jgi:hypothetical protein